MEYSTTDQQQALDREYREQWIRTLIAQPKGVLTSGEKIVGTALAWHMNMNANNPWHRAAWMKAGNLAAEVAMTTGSTTNALKSLWEKGWLRRIGRTDNGRGSWVYSFVYPDNVTPFGTQVAADNGVHYPMESTIQWSQVAADNGVRPHQGMESDPTGRLTESLKDSSKDSSNQPPEGGADDFGNFDDEKPDDVTAAIEEFRAAYPKSAATHVLDKPFREQLKQGATAGELIRAAQKYAEECKFHNKALVHISAPARFLKEETWRSYAQLQDSGGDDSESIVERFKRIRAEEESLEEDCPF